MIRWIQNSKKYLKDSMKIFSNSICFIQFQLYGNYEMESNFQKLDLLEICSIWFENLQFDWFERWKKFEKFDKNQFENCSIRFDSTPIKLSSLCCCCCKEVWEEHLTKKYFSQTKRSCFCYHSPIVIFIGNLTKVFLR